MDELISRIIAVSGLNEELARKAIGIILAFLQKEGPPAEIGQLMTSLPGAQELADAEGGAKGGLMGMVGGMMGGGGGVMALGGQLRGAGRSMGQTQSVSKEMRAGGREQAAEDTMGAIVGAIPGLGQFV